jgi:hypothetical protein
VGECPRIRIKIVGFDNKYYQDHLISVKQSHLDGFGGLLGPFGAPPVLFLCPHGWLILRAGFGHRALYGVPISAATKVLFLFNNLASQPGTILAHKRYCPAFSII